jgi:hypothetical protein
MDTPHATLAFILLQPYLIRTYLGGCKSALSCKPWLSNTSTEPKNARSNRLIKGARSRYFQVGDAVYKLQPYVQSSLSARSNQKLAFKFFGPFRVLERVGAVAYKLDLPPSTTIHRVFHVSQLKQAHGDQPVSPVLPTDLSPMQHPKKILQRFMSPGDNPVLQGLVQWSGMHPSLATWEDLDVFRCRFPGVAPWGQDATQGRGIVSSTLLVDHDKRTMDHEDEAHQKPRRATRPNLRVHGPEWQV